MTQKFVQICQYLSSFKFVAIQRRFFQFDSSRISQVPMYVKVNIWICSGATIVASMNKNFVGFFWKFLETYAGKRILKFSLKKVPHFEVEYFRCVSKISSDFFHRWTGFLLKLLKESSPLISEPHQAILCTEINTLILPKIKSLKFIFAYYFFWFFSIKKFFILEYCRVFGHFSNFHVV